MFISGEVYSSNMCTSHLTCVGSEKNWWFATRRFDQYALIFIRKIFFLHKEKWAKALSTICVQYNTQQRDQPMVVYSIILNSVINQWLCTV